MLPVFTANAIEGRFIGGLSPSDQLAITTKGSPHNQEISCKSGIRGTKGSPINRPSMVVFRRMMRVFRIDKCFSRKQ
jgi:hypothetical protein